MNRTWPLRGILSVVIALAACTTAMAPDDHPGDDTPPVNAALPNVSGVVQEGQPLTTSDGSWTGTAPMTYTRQWKRCGATGGACVDIVGATGTTYLLAAGDVGATIRASVTATNAAGSATAQSEATAIVAELPPASTPPTNATLPGLSGAAQEGQLLTGSDGTWNGSVPIAYTRQWKRCNASGSSCTNISGATGSSYTLVTADVGSTIRFSVTASNGAGAATAQSAPTAVVTAIPSNGSCPQLPSPPPGYCTGQVYTLTPGNATIPTLQPGDVVVFENGIYTDTDGDGTIVQIQQGGTATQYVTFVARNTWGAKIDGQNNTARYGFNFAAVSYVRLEGFDIYGMGSSYAGTVVAPSASGVMILTGGGNSQIVGNNIHNISNFCNPTIRAQTGVFIGRSNVLVEGNVIHDIGRYDPGENGCTYPSGFNKFRNSDTGVYLQFPNHSNITIRNNVFYNHRNGWGIYVYQGGPENVKILNNTFAFGNPYWSSTHIFTDADLIDFEIRNNIFYDPAGGYAMAWDLEPLENVVITNNVASGQLLLSGADGSPITTLPPGMSQSNNRFSTDPMFVNPSNYDFHLLAGSPAIDWGMSIGEVTHDIERRARPQGGGYDAGAYERP